MYSHYYEKRHDLSDRAWQLLVEDVNWALKKTPRFTDSAGGYYKDQPLKGQLVHMAEGAMFAASHESPDVEDLYCGLPCITLNGEGELGCDTFALVHNWPVGRSAGQISGCSTDRKPYDLLVCAILIFLYRCDPTAYKISSDGKHSDWLPALRFVRQRYPDAQVPKEVGHFTPPEHDIRAFLVEANNSESLYF